MSSGHDIPSIIIYGYIYIIIPIINKYNYNNMIILIEYFILIGTLRHTQGKIADCKAGFSSRLKCSLVFESIRIWSQIWVLVFVLTLVVWPRQVTEPF